MTHIVARPSLRLMLLINIALCSIQSAGFAQQAKLLSDLYSLVSQREQMSPMLEFKGQVKTFDCDNQVKTLFEYVNYDLTVDFTSAEYKLTERHNIASPHWALGSVITYAWDGKSYSTWSQHPLETGTDKIAPRKPGTVSVSESAFATATLYDRAFARSSATYPIKDFLRDGDLQVIDQNATIAGEACVQLRNPIIELWISKASGIVMKLEWYLKSDHKDMWLRVQVDSISSTGVLAFPTHVTVENFNASLQGKSVLSDITVDPSSLRIATKSDLDLDLPPGTMVYDVATKTQTYVAGRSAHGNGIESVEERLNTLVEKAMQAQHD